MGQVSLLRFHQCWQDTDAQSETGDLSTHGLATCALANSSQRGSPDSGWVGGGQRLLLLGGGLGAGQGTTAASSAISCHSQDGTQVTEEPEDTEEVPAWSTMASGGAYIFTLPQFF